ncbi:MAG: 3-isopropylmalate dehydratase large subunit, partial [Thermoanaerobaculia bacterium]|nr:3-isopropylmalate dehydratase large subunit [Thermoanaerobaculia bacterium]
PRTLFDKIWDQHVAVPAESSAPAVLGIDLHFIHEVTSPQAFADLDARGLRVRCPGQTVATMDHSTPTLKMSRKALAILDPRGAEQLERLESNCARHGVPLFALDNEHQGIVHVIGPELGLTQPGMTIVCGDSHTSTHGAFGALAFGIGTSEVGHVLATQCLLQRRPKTFEIRVDGTLNPGVTAKDLVLYLISKLGIDAGTGHVLEYRGEAIRALSMEGRMTVCNMSIEAGARAGMVAPDETTFSYLRGRPFAPQGEAWDQALERWHALPSDSGAEFDRRIAFDASEIEPMLTYGTNPAMAMAVGGRVPDHAVGSDGDSFAGALDYMGLVAGEALAGRRVDVVFIGSCTNARLSDLEAAADIFRGRRVAPHVRALVVPGSQEVKRQAEAAGLHQVFVDAGAEWREAGCSMCLAMNGDQLEPGQYAVSTSNRNFEGRQGPGGRTLLASPLTAAAAAVAGEIVDVREMMKESASSRQAVSA